VSFTGCIFLTAFNPVMAFFQSPARAWEFSLGGPLSFVPVRWSTAHQTLCKCSGMAGLLSLILCSAWIADSSTFPGYIAAIPVLATVAILQAGAGAPGSLVARLLNWRVLRYLGGISYSLYLWHWPTLGIAREIHPTNSPAVRAAGVILTFLLAAMTHVTVENPVRFNSFLLSRSSLSLRIAGLSSMICIAGFGIWWAALDHSTHFRKFDQAHKDVPALYGNGCQADWSDATPRVCSFGEISKPESIVVLFGDSHAAQCPALKEIAESRHWKLVTIIKSACSPMNIGTSSMDTSRAIKICEQWRKLAIAVIQEMHPDTVIMSSSSRYSRHDSPNLLDASEWEKGSRDTLIAIARQGTAVRLIRDTLHANYDVTLCLAQFAWNGHASCPPLMRASA
jgi:hypothetical protein